MKQVILTSMLLVTLLVSYTGLRAAPTPAPVAQAASTSVFGLNSHIASRYPDYGTLSRPAGLVKELALGWAREDVQWSRVEPQPGRFDWSWHDTVFDLHRRNGVNIIGVIGPSVGWATAEPGDANSGVSYYAPDPERYAAFAKAVATRYKGKVQAWEIWNEPENGN
ncbi:MAG: beta-galactosidase, partial [Chloroflexi bacterium]|nr:beta-galactosidase [Chloroflexota bacterium]